MSDPRGVLLASSELLTYPDTSKSARWRELRGTLEDLPLRPRRQLGSFLRYLESADLLAAQQEYVRTFDLQGGVPLYLTYPRFKDDRERGQALADLKGRYRAAGLSPQTSELPDYLPMFLEFIGLAEPGAARELATEYLDTLEGFACRLHERRSPYAQVLEASLEAVRALLHPSWLRRWTV